MVKSSNGGRTWLGAQPIDNDRQGTCGCCSMAALVQKTRVYVLYRTALDDTARDTTLLSSQNGGTTFASTNLQSWRARTCPMTLFSLSSAAIGLPVLGAWETKGAISISKLTSSELSFLTITPRASAVKLLSLSAHSNGGVAQKQGSHSPVSASAKPTAIVQVDAMLSSDQKYPSVCENDDGSSLVCWIDGAGWERGGKLRWRFMDRTTVPNACDSNHGSVKFSVTWPDANKAPSINVPPWSFASAVALRKGEYAIIY